jgi:hypothetical protein
MAVAPQGPTQFSVEELGAVRHLIFTKITEGPSKRAQSVDHALCSSRQESKGQQIKYLWLKDDDPA